MIIEKYSSKKRTTKLVELQSDFVVVGGGLSGVCSAITAARSGLKVVLIQDRPVLGGNASSEVRLWSLGATSHMGNNNRWSREGGLINEILLDNLKKNKEGNPLIFDTILLEKVYEENNITLLLNTSVYEVAKNNSDSIKSVTGFCSQNSTTYIAKAPLFCDASGDGIVGFMAGASFRMGAENKEEFDEGFSPNVNDYGDLLGHSLYFYTKDLGKPVSYTAPSFAIKDAGSLPSIKNYQLNEHGCKLWWVEYGGRLDTIHESENIKFELWKVIYGIWDYVKNSGKYPESENLTLEWVGTIPGKRESRRFEGDFMLSQRDIVEQRDHYDAVSYGGWAMDLHPADGVYSKHSSCMQWHSKGVYTIPYRCFYSKDINNLFLAGRIISASHVAFGSTRVMLTCAHGGQVVGKAASLCISNNLLPRAIALKENIKRLQLELNLEGQSIPNIPIDKESNLTNAATLIASSELEISTIPFDGKWTSLTTSAAQLLPFNATQSYTFKIVVNAEEAAVLEVQLRIAEKVENYSPEIIIESKQIKVKKGEQEIVFKFTEKLKEDRYAFVTFLKNDNISLKNSTKRYTGVLSVFNGVNKAVSNTGKQTPPDAIGIDSFEFWTPQRRPKGENIAMDITPAITSFSVNNIGNGYVRPWIKTNAWVSDLEDKNPTLKLNWEVEKEISEIKIFFDADYDHSMETTLMGHPEEVVPFVVQEYVIKDASGTILVTVLDNYQAINTFSFPIPIKTKGLIIELAHPSIEVPASVFEIICR
ncbi:MAG: FAD-dependent oxidoreductase [Flavobacteriaceae bacterium]|nr:FAD-dependent oxidoreductase [Flavobacteriaceae bacterium]